VTLAFGRAADAVGRVKSFAQKAAVDYVSAYQSRGDAPLITYDDRSKPVKLQELKAYLEQYPKGSLPGARDVFYWANENYGFKPILSIVHGVVYQPPAKSDRAYVVQKQIYASHYFEGSLAVATLLSKQLEQAN
jgi:hypothetical protein